MPLNGAYDLNSISVEMISTVSVTITIRKAYGTNPKSFGGAMTSTGSFNDPDFVINVNEPLVSYTTTTINGLTPGSKYSVRVRGYANLNQSGDYGNYLTTSFTMPKSSNPAGITSTSKLSAIAGDGETNRAGASSMPISSTSKVLSSTSGNSTFTYSAANPYYGSSSSTSVVDTDVMSRSVLNKIASSVASSSNDDDVSNSEVGSGDNSVPETRTGSSTATAGNKSIQRSLLKIDNPNTNLDTYSVLLKNTGISTGSTYYSFGTGMFFPSTNNNTVSCGGIGFFANSTGTTGYVIQLESTNNVTKDHKEVRVLKVVNGVKKPLDDQLAGGKTLQAVYGATLYRIDAFVKTTSTENTIDVYVNGYQIKIVDKDVSDINQALTPTANIFLYTNLGSAYFDYAYATPMSEAQYDKKTDNNVFSGQFAKTTLDFLYGDRTVSNLGKAEIAGGYLEEFGTTARELRRVNIKFASRPGFPLFPSLGINQYVHVLGSRLTSYGADMYIVNNAGTFIPIDDSQGFSFVVVGNYVSSPGDQEYNTTVSGPDTYSESEPVAFESIWIQTESDAKYLADWIKTQWSKQQSVVNMNVFGNPLISVGDVITINYPSNGFDGTKKFIVTNVNNSFTEGVDTTITARSIYS